jgi:hypothetical protein
VLLLLAVWVGLGCLRGLTIGSALEKINADPRAAGSSPTARLGGYAHISKRIVQDFLSRNVTFNETVTEPILNMTTRGRARVDCQIGFELLPNPRAANLRVLMIGRVMMDDAVSTRRSVRVFSTSQTRISGYQDVLLDAEGLHLGAARASGSTSIQVYDLDARRFVERPAWRRVGRLQPRAEQAASSHGARRAEQHLESEVAKSAAHLRHKCVEQVLRTLSDAGVSPDVWLATTSAHLSVRLLRSAALVDPSPAVNPPRPAAWDLAVCVKDSFVNETITPFVAGKTYTDRDFADVMLTLTGKTPRPLWVHARTEPWNVTAAKEQPLVISFAGEGVGIKLRIDHASHGQQRLDRTLEISAKYTLEITLDGPHLIRSGDLAVEFTDAAQQRPEPSETDFREFLARKFSGVFLSDIYFDGLMPPQGGSWGKLRRLELKQLWSRDGWFAIGYELRSTSQIVNARKSTGR